MRIKKVLVANRGEIAIRVFRACFELGLKTVAIYTYEDRYSQHRYKADEAYQLGKDEEAIKPYLAIEDIIHLAKEKGVDAIHPGYGFLSENAEFVRRCVENGIIFIGPDAGVMQALGDKISAKKIAKEIGIPVIESSVKDLHTLAEAQKEASRIGYPLMLKAAAGGGGRGMRLLRKPEDLENAFGEAQREALNAFGDQTVFLEKFVENPKHVEVQVVADNHGNMVHLYERDCSVQRRYQKVVEVAPSFGLPDKARAEMHEFALRICRAVNYNNVGTVEFLLDGSDRIYFIEVNPRIQVEHTVTEMVTGIDLIKTQIFVAGGYRLSDKQIKISSQDAIHTNGYAVQCRVTTEDPENDFKPDYGTVITYRSPGGFGIRLDAGSVYQGAVISPFFDSMLVKISAWSRTLDGACRKMHRALQEFRIRGVKTNIPFLENLINHKVFHDGKATVGFIEEYRNELFVFQKRMDRATRLVRFLGDVIVNGNPDVKGAVKEKKFPKPVIPAFDHYASYTDGTKQLLTRLGPEKFAEWLKKEEKIHFTDTTMRDAHQSLLATRMRTYDMLRVAESFSRNHPQVFSMEVWGGATFDVCMRFLHENPWRRLQELRKAVPNILLQMLLRGSNAVGYTSYPDNLVEKFVAKSSEYGIDVFRIFDSLNWLKAMEPSIKAVRTHTGGIAEVAMCYTGDILDPSRTKYSLDYYLRLAKDIENSGAHILAIKDMAGLLKPYAAYELVTALKSTVNIPIHLHTHDTSSLQSATYMKAIEAGVDVVDVALGGLSGLTSQPNFNSVVEMMNFHKRENRFDMASLNQFSNYWEDVRAYYYPFESGLKAGTAEVFYHEMPGGQYSNLVQQAEALGVGSKFEEIKKTYHDVNLLFGDIVKVTPSSKVVGDMTLYMISNGLTAKDIQDRGDTLSFPESVQGFFMGNIGQPPGGFPEKLQQQVLKDKKPIEGKADPVDIDKEFSEFRQKFKAGELGRPLDITDFLSYKMYPKVFENTFRIWSEYGFVSRIPTRNFFYGMELNEETIIEFAPGKSIIVRLLSVGPAKENGMRTIFFKVNGQTRNIEVTDRSLNIKKEEHLKAEAGNLKQIGAPLQGMLSKVFVKKGQKVKRNQPLFVIEAMKMETTVTATAESEIKDTFLKEGARVNADDLVVQLN
ncbi:MAG: pyruvate carboxylase [Bacteroidia bacterium]|nr:pyruvate carboxylase [Bacteroidia bacterium]